MRGNAAVETTGQCSDQPAVSLETSPSMEAERWNRFVDRSPEGTVLHRTEALDVIAEHAGATLHRLVGYADDRLVGVMPVFERSIGPATALFSSPPGMGLPPLSPCFGNGGMQPGERTVADWSFLADCWDHLDATHGPDYVRLALDRNVPATALTVQDGVALSPRFTYVLDLEAGSDDLFSGFSSDARRNVRNADEDRYEIREGDRPDIRRIVERMQDRYREQGLRYPVSPEFATDLYDRLPGGALRPYVVTVDGEFANGLLALDDGLTVSRWQGGGKAEVDLPVNDLLDWHVIEEAVDRDRSRYDFVGANTASICDYKAKFNPDLVEGCVVERSSTGMQFVRGAYERLSDHGIWPSSLF